MNEVVVIGFTPCVSRHPPLRVADFRGRLRVVTDRQHDDRFRPLKHVTRVSIGLATPLHVFHAAMKTRLQPLLKTI